MLVWGDIYNDPSLVRFYQNKDIPLWGNSKRKEKREDGPEWVVRNKFEDELANFMLEKKYHMKGIGEMLDQHRKEMHEQFSQILFIIRESNLLEPEAPTFAITTRSRISTQDPLSQVYRNRHLPTMLKGQLKEKDLRVQNQALCKMKKPLAGHLSRLENPDLGKLTKAKIRDFFPKELLMEISNKNNEPWMRHSYSNNAHTESYEGVSQEMRRHKSFDNVTTTHQEGIMVLPQPQERSLKPAFTGQVSSTMHIDWSEVAMPINEPVTSPLGMKHLKSTSKSKKYSMSGPFPSSNGNKCILVAIDYVSKWVESQTFSYQRCSKCSELPQEIIHDIWNTRGFD
uniref:Reverse transcriptase domain-containing protein n=1 Tax=Tanacetum cinerariifolium TaxID=118510 RepID=A0A699I0Y1_TANCI|nr:hypothetical protein [Tanacetum cinerariifolium]